jgi:hypothetical protein
VSPICAACAAIPINIARAIKAICFIKLIYEIRGIVHREGSLILNGIFP